LIKRYFQGLSGAIETMRIVKELVEIWPNKVCDIVTFYSKSLLPVERNYKTHDKEMFAIICALEEWRHFLEGD